MEDSHCSQANDNGVPRHHADLRRALAECLAATTETTFEKIESSLMRIANEAVRDVLANELQRHSDELPTEVLVDGVRYRRHLAGTVRIHSLCGGFDLRRWTYRRVGERNGSTCVPIELEAGIVERTTPALAYGILTAYAKSHMRDHERTLHAAHRDPPSRSTLERVAKALGGRVKTLARKIEPVLRKDERLPDHAHGIVIGLDRTTIPMEEDAKVKRRRLTQRRDRPYVRTPPPPVEVNYRMAYVGTVTIVDRGGEPLVTRRYAVGAHVGAAPLIRRVRRDLRHALLQKRDLVVAVVQDGACELRNLMLEALRAERLVKKFHIVLDFFHVVERLALVLKLVEPDENRRQKQLVRWKRALLRNDHAIYEITKKIRRVLARWYDMPNKRTAWRELFGHEGYLHGGAFHMRYARIAALGIPVGSGVTEGACKSMITSRLKRSGQRWRPTGVDAVLSIRTLLESDRFDLFWTHFQRESRAAIRAA